MALWSCPRGPSKSWCMEAGLEWLSHDRCWNGIDGEVMECWGDCPIERSKENPSGMVAEVVGLDMEVGVDQISLDGRISSVVGMSSSVMVMIGGVEGTSFLHEL
jgi:hypothetical protein